MYNNNNNNNNNNNSNSNNNIDDLMNLTLLIDPAYYQHHCFNQCATPSSSYCYCIQ